MKRFAVAVQLIKFLPSGTEQTTIRVIVVDANDAEHALGRAINNLKTPDYRIGACQAVEVPGPETTSAPNYFELVRQWGIDRNLHTQEPSKQMCKVIEEVGELSAAIIRGDGFSVTDGVGDAIVTLIILAQQYGLDAEKCLATAYEVIKDRKGETKDGVFVKESDL